jgi:hypothetical protein
MISAAGALLVAVLLLFLILVWVRANLARRDELSSHAALLAHETEGLAVCPQEFVSRIFEGQDLEFISGFESPQLQKFFRCERNAVALLWVQQTTTYIRRVMQLHLEASRRSEDLHVATEVKIFAQYAQLRFLCGILFVSIEVLGPQKLRGVALYAQELTQQLGHAQMELDSAR